MEQVSQYISGERDYTKIQGGTGPLVYPAAHVYIYWGLYHVTEQGKNILTAQRIFAALYISSLAVVLACYRRAKVGFTSLETEVMLTETGSALCLPNADFI